MKRPSLEDRFWSKVDIRTPFECWPWKAATRKKDEGYGAFWMNGRHHPASRVVWGLIFEGKIEDGFEICHHCDNQNCCNPEHLFKGTRKQNNDDKVLKNRHVFGERVHTTKLDPQKVNSIRWMLSQGIVRWKIANMFGISQSQVTNIKLGYHWKQLPKENYDCQG